VLGVEPHGLLVISVPLRGTGSLVRIPMTADGRLVPESPVRLPDVAWGWPITLSSDGDRAILRHALAAPDQTIAREVELTIDLQSHRVIATKPDAPSVAPPVIGPTLAGAFPRTARTEFLDGVIEVAWDGDQTMAHSVSDTSVRRYFEHWYFKGGQIRMLHRAGDRWTVVDPVPLALHDADGTMHTGYTPVVLRNGRHAAVLIAPDGSGPAWFQPYRVPCTPARP
jgi:hypothetical protein